MTVYITILVKKYNGTTPHIACHTGLNYIHLSDCIYYSTCTESVLLHPATHQHLLLLCNGMEGDITQPPSKTGLAYIAHAVIKNKCGWNNHKRLLRIQGFTMHFIASHFLKWKDSLSVLLAI